MAVIIIQGLESGTLVSQGFRGSGPQTYSEVGSGGAFGGGAAIVEYISATQPAPRIGPYPTITFQVNLDTTATRGIYADDNPANRTYLLSLERIFIPGVGEFKHGDQFTLFGQAASYLYQNMRQVGRSAGDPLSTLQVLSIS